MKCRVRYTCAVGVSQRLPITFCVYCVLGFWNRVLSHMPKRNIKTKLQIYTSPQHVINTLLCARARQSLLFYDLSEVDRHVFLMRSSQSNLGFRFWNPVRVNVNLAWKVVQALRGTKTWPMSLNSPRKIKKLLSRLFLNVLCQTEKNRAVARYCFYT